METEEIISKIQSGLKKASEQNGISKSDIRVKLSLKKALFGKALKSTLMSSNSDIKDLDLGVLLGIPLIKMPLLTNYLSNTLSKMGQSINGCSEFDVNAIILTKVDNFYPSVFLYNKSELVREITIQELLS